MRSKRVALVICLSTMVLPLLSGCSIKSAALQTPDDFIAGGGSYPVSGHSTRYAGKPVQFGPYSTQRVDGSGLPTRTTFLAGRFGVGRESRDYGFLLTEDNTQQVEAYCRSSIWFSRLILGKLQLSVDHETSKPAFSCGFAEIPNVGDSGSSAGESSMALWFKGADFAGDIQFTAGKTYSIQSLRTLEGIKFSMGQPLGYTITEGGKTLAVIDLVNDGRVSFAPALPERERRHFAAVAAALLMLGGGSPG